MDDNEKLLELLREKQNANLKQISEIRKDRLHLEQRAQTSYSELLNKFAELSLAVSLAVIPIVLLSNKTPKHKILFFIGIGILVVNGFILIVNRKNKIEFEMTRATGSGLEMENELLVLKNKLNKTIIFYQEDNKANVLDYFKSEAELVARLSDKIEQPSVKYDFSADVAYMLMITAVLLIGSELWPFRVGYYIILITIVLCSLFVFILISFQRIKKNAENNIALKHKSNQIRTEGISLYKELKNSVFKSDQSD